MNSNLRLALAAVCIVVLTLCSAMLANKLFGRARIDLTEHKIYTLSDGTRNILGKLNQPLKASLYYSRVAAMKGPEQIRFYNDYFLYVRDLLDEYAGLSGGKLKLNVIDPRPFSDEEEEAVRYGIKRIPLSDDESFCFGLVLRTELGNHKVIEFFDPTRQEFVEYDISKLVLDITRREKRKIGVISPLPVTGDDLSPYMMQMMQMQGRRPQQPWNIITHLKDQYDVENLGVEIDAVPDDVDFLMAIHPKDLKEKTLFAIDQYVMRGGKLLAFVDPHCLSDEPPEDPQNPYGRFEYSASSDLDTLLRGWGVEVDPQQIVSDRRLAVKAQLRDRAEPLSIFLGLNESCVNVEQVVTAHLHSLQMLFAGSITKLPDAETSITPLLTTTSAGGVWEPQAPYELHMPDPHRIDNAVLEGSEPLTLACVITGNLKTNFPDGIALEDEDDTDGDDTGESGSDETGEAAGDATGEAEGEEEAEEAPPVVREAPEDAVVMVFADVDFITDQLAYQSTFFGSSPRGDNSALVLNALEYLSGTGDLIAIRSRGRFNRPFVKVDQIEAEAEKATAAEMEAISRKIAEYEEKLRQLSAGASSEEDVELVRSAALSERQKLQEEIYRARREQRMLQDGKRKQIESLKASLQTHNMVWAPVAVLVIAIILAIVRTIRAKRYAARRM